MLGLTYESALENGETHQAAANRSFGFLGLPPVAVSSPLVKLYAGPPKSQVKNFEEIVRTAKRLGVKPISANDAP